MQGTIKSNGYPNIVTRSRYEIESSCILNSILQIFHVYFYRYCDWKIKLPRGYHVVVDVQDLPEYSRSSSIYYLMVSHRSAIFSLSSLSHRHFLLLFFFLFCIQFYNDFNFRSTIKVLRPNSTTKRVTSSSNTMMIGSYTSSGYRGFKLHYFAEAPARTFVEYPSNILDRID